MCSPTSAHTASSTHWPSWSQAPFWWGSPKSPSAIGPSTARHDLATAGSPSGGAGQHVAAADAPLGAHQAGALEGEQDLLEVGLGERRCARRCRGPTWARARRRAARATAAPGRRSHLGSRPSRAHAYGAAPRRPMAGARGAIRLPGATECVDCSAVTDRRPRRSRTTPAPACATSCRPCSGPASGRRCPTWMPGAGARRPPGRAARARRPRLGAAAGPPRASARRCRRWPAARSRTVAPTTTATALTLDRHRADARRARRGRLPHRRRTARCSTCCAGRRRRRRPPRRIPPREFQPFAAFLGADVPVVTPAEFASTGFTAAHLRGSRASRLPGCRRRSWSRSAACCAAGEPLRLRLLRRASTRSPTSTASASYYDAELRAADRLVGRPRSTRCRPGAVLLVTADHGQVEVGDRIVDARSATCSPWCALQSGEGRFRWLHARPGRGRRPARRRPTARYGDVAWVVTRRAGRRRGLVRRRRSPRRSPAAWATWRSSPATPVGFHDPADTGPVRARSAATARSPPAEMLVPLLAAPRDGAERRAPGWRRPDDRRDCTP